MLAVSFLALRRTHTDGHLRLLTSACFAEAHSAPSSHATANEVEARRLWAEGNDAEHFGFDDSGLDGVVVDEV